MDKSPLKSPLIIAVHCGAGTHSYKLYNEYNKLCRKACRKGIQILKNGGTALEAIKVAIAILEDDPLTNSGFGSNLTNIGTVEGDASIMDGTTLNFGACGATKSIKNPIHLAHDICMKQSDSLPFGLIPPSLLVGDGADLYAKDIGLKMVRNQSLISAKSQRQYKRYKKLMTSKDGELLDTVGAVCMDINGHVAAGCSSGGIILKKPGRVGQAAIYSAGVWADSSAPEEEHSVAVCTTGCGEHLIKTQLAKEIAQDVKTSLCPTVGLSQSIREKFVNSRFLTNVKQKLCGALVLHVNHQTGDIAVLWGHTSDTMSVGFMNSVDDKSKGIISELPKGAQTGSTVNVSGSYLYSQKNNM